MAFSRQVQESGGTVTSLLADYDAQAARMTASDVADAQAELWDALVGLLPGLDEVSPRTLHRRRKSSGPPC